MTTTVGTLSNRTFAAALFARASSVENAVGYVSEAINVPLKADSTDQVKPYWVLHPGVHEPVVEPDLGESVVEGEWTWQVTVVGATRNDVLDLTDRLKAVFFRWIPTVDGLVLGPCVPPTGYRPLVLPDKDFTPHRLFVPLQYVTTATAATTTT